MKYAFLLFAWIVFLVILTMLKVSVIIKFLPYILIVTFFALVFATYKTIHDDAEWDRMDAEWRAEQDKLETEEKAENEWVAKWQHHYNGK